jgi:hypothetical protein
MYLHHAAQRSNDPPVRANIIQKIWPNEATNTVKESKGHACVTMIHKFRTQKQGDHSPLETINEAPMHEGEPEDENMQNSH